MKNFCKVTGGIFLFLQLVINIVSAQNGWVTLQSGTQANLYSVHFINVDSGFVTGEAGTVFKTVDAGANWQDISIPQSTKLNDIYFFDADTGLVVGENGTIFRTVDGGSNWNTIPNGVMDNLLSVDFLGTHGICGASSQTILYTSDRGNSWSIAQSGFFGGGFYSAVLLSPQIGFVGGENSIFQPLVGGTVDGGMTWNFVSFYLGINEGKIFGIDFTDINTGYVASGVWDGRGGISKTVDGGANWTTQFFNNVLYDIDFPISNTSLVGYAVGDSGLILYTYDAGGNWQIQPSSVITTLRGVHFLDFDNGYVVGDNGTILKTSSGGIVSIPDSKTPEFNLPENFRFHQNYPNPFNPSTMIKYDLLKAVKIKIEIFNLSGQKIETLINKNMPAGSHEFEFTARDLPSGVYYLRFGTGDPSVGYQFPQMKKMILLK